MKTKKKMMCLLLAVCMVLTLMPTTALAEETESARSSKTVITTVQELQQFAEAVNRGDYDAKTDAVVSLEADLDMTGIAWTPIGCADDNGDVKHYFSGKFYGNGHTISNFDFSSSYGIKMVGGFFGYIENAEVFSLKIQGKLDVTTDKEYTYFGTVAGYAAGCKIFDCVSEVAFANNGKYVYGCWGMCGYAQDTMIEYCESSGAITVTGDMGSLYLGGIAGYITGNSEIRYCSNIGDLQVNATHAGGIAGQLGTNAKIMNSFFKGNLTPIGKGIEDIGGIAGTVSGGAEISHCYFAGEINLSKYTAASPYGRFGGIAGKIESETSNFSNNYFVEKEKVSACGKNNISPGASQTLEYMKSEDFYKEVKEGGGDYQFEEGNSPVLPKPKYRVSFIVTPSDLANHVIKVNDVEITGSTRELEAGTYTVTATADDYNSVSKEITITADTATHTQTIPFTKKYSGGSYVPVQKPEIITGEGGKTDLTDHGSTLVITPDAGMQIEKVLVNGKEVKVSDHKVKGLKTGDKVEVTFSRIPPTKAQIDKAIKTSAGNLKLTVRTSKTPKKNIKALVRQDAAIKNLLQEVKEAGYTVKYKFYRSESKKSGYAARLTKTTGVYLNTEGQANAKYYYKAKLQILDREGKTIAETSLKQCRFGVRIWTKGQK